MSHINGLAYLEFPDPPFSVRRELEDEEEDDMPAIIIYF